MDVSKMLRKFSTRGAKCAAIILAAGTASRMAGIDKIMADLEGEPLIIHTLRAFEQNDDVHEIVLVTREDLQQPLSQLCVKYKIGKLTKICQGGQTRAASVQAGLDQVSSNCALVAIHDGARPLVPQAVIHDAVRKAAKFNAAAPGLPVKDTIKLVHGGVVESTLDRSALYQIQTPQVFALDLYRAALDQAMAAKEELTDDCSAAEKYGINVVITPGSEENIKITTPTDLRLAQFLLQGRRAQ